MGVGGVMTLKATGIVTITEITQKTSGPPVKFPYRGPAQKWSKVAPVYGIDFWNAR